MRFSIQSLLLLLLCSSLYSQTVYFFYEDEMDDVAAWRGTENSIYNWGLIDDYYYPCGLDSNISLSEILAVMDKKEDGQTIVFMVNSVDEDSSDYSSSITVYYRDDFHHLGEYVDYNISLLDFAFRQEFVLTMYDQRDYPVYEKVLTEKNDDFPFPFFESTDSLFRATISWKDEVLTETYFKYTEHLGNDQ